MPRITSTRRNGHLANRNIGLWTPGEISPPADQGGQESRSSRMVWSFRSDGKLTDSRRPDFREFLPPRAGLVYSARVIDKQLGKAVADFEPNSAILRMARPSSRRHRQINRPPGGPESATPEITRGCTLTSLRTAEQQLIISVGPGTVSLRAYRNNGSSTNSPTHCPQGHPARPRAAARPSQIRPNQPSWAPTTMTTTKSYSTSSRRHPTLQ